MSKKLELPLGWRIESGCIDIGTGYGDDRYGLILYEYRTWTTGFWIFKRDHQGWVEVRTDQHTDTKSHNFLAEYVQQTVQMREVLATPPYLERTR